MMSFGGYKSLDIFYWLYTQKWIAKLQDWHIVCFVKCIALAKSVKVSLTWKSWQGAELPPVPKWLLIKKS